LASGMINPRADVDRDILQRIVRPAVEQSRSHMDQVFAAAAKDVDERVRAWSERVAEWQEAASGMTQFEGLRARRLTVDQEREIAESMAPSQALVRPLLVVAPKEGI